jgi:hypothetical protein
MGRAIAWTAIFGLILVLGTHPSVMAGLIQHLFNVLRGAGDELSAFISSL